MTDDVAGEEGTVEAEPEVVRYELVPKGDRIFVRQDAAADTYRGGRSVILTPEETKDKERPLTGIVLWAGPESDCKDGERIMFTAYSGNKVKWDDEELLVMRGEDVLATLTDA